MCCRFIINLLVFSVAASVAFAETASKIPRYRVGETARVDVVATVGFAAIDPEKTEALRQKEAPQVPVIYRWNTNAVEEAVVNLRDAFATNRQNFMVAVQAAFNKNVLDDRGLTNQRYRRLVTSFQSANKGFPFSTNLANAWARGDADEEFIVPFEYQLRNLMGRFIRPDEHIPESKIGWQIKLVASDATSPLLWPQVEKTRGVARSNVVAVGKVRIEYRNETSPEPRAAGRFVSLFIQPTCIPDGALTRELREKEVGSLSSVSRYEPGDSIVREGQVVTAGIKAALDEFRARLAMLQGPAPQTWPPSITPWLLASGAVLAALGAAFFVWMRFRRKTIALALMPDSLGQEAALAVKNDPVIRARLMEHLTRLLGNSIMQKLLAQRGQLLKTQHTAAVQTEVLEQRLEKVQSDMQERFGAYEQRIAELEQELAAAEEENRDLIRAKIAIAKEELERARATGRITWN